MTRTSSNPARARQWRRATPLTARILRRLWTDDGISRQVILDLQAAAREAAGKMPGIVITADIDDGGMAEILVKGWGQMLEEFHRPIHLDLVRGTWEYSVDLLWRSDEAEAEERQDKAHRLQSTALVPSDDALLTFLGNALSEAMEIQTRARAIAASEKLKRPLRICMEQNIGHVRIDRDIARIIIENEGADVLESRIRCTLANNGMGDERIDTFHYDSQLVAASAEAMADNVNPPYITFDGMEIVITDISLPEIVIAAMPGRQVRDLIKTGRNTIDERIVTEAYSETNQGITAVSLIVEPQPVTLIEAGLTQGQIDGKYPRLANGQLPDEAYIDPY